jgi:hypothetical protein
MIEAELNDVTRSSLQYPRWAQRRVITYRCLFVEVLGETFDWQRA